MPPALRYLGWGALDVRLGEGPPGGVRWTPVPLDWQPGDVRGCSWASAAGLVGITAEDRTSGGQVLATLDPATGRTEVLARPEYVLAHDLDANATHAAYLVPGREGTADLWLWSRDAAPRLVLTGAGAQDAVPAFVPGAHRVVLHDAGGEMRVVDLKTGEATALGAGRGPVPSEDGRRIAFRRDDDVLTRSVDGGEEMRVEVPGGSRSPAGNLGWSPDGAWLTVGSTAGMTDKETEFHLVQIETGRAERISGRYLRGLRPIGPAEGGAR